MDLGKWSTLAFQTCQENLDPIYFECLRRSGLIQLVKEEDTLQCQLECTAYSTESCCTSIALAQRCEATVAMPCKVELDRILDTGFRCGK